jgi:hypothetical protein
MPKMSALRAWALGLEHWALGIGRWALGIGHWLKPKAHANLTHDARHADVIGVSAKAYTVPGFDEDARS